MSVTRAVGTAKIRKRRSKFMVSFGLEAKDGAGRTRVFTVRDRLRSNDLFKNPFTARFKEQSKGFFLVSIEPVWPPVWWASLPSCVILASITHGFFM